MKTLIKNGKLLLPDRVVTGDLLIEQGLIKQIDTEIPAGHDHDIIDASGKYIIPGFIDIHNHGAAAFDFSFGKYDQEHDSFEQKETKWNESLETALEFYVHHGVSRVLLTSMAAPLEKLEFAFSSLKQYLEAGNKLGDLIGGINVEGTFLKDPAFAGAQNPRFFNEASISVIERLQVSSGNRIKIVNVPPEHGEKGLELIRYLHKENIVIAGGHTSAYGDEFQKAVNEGLSLSVHFFNGPSRNSTKGFRQGGAEQIMLLSDQVSTEIICDGYHVHPRHVRDTIARKEDSRVIMITDSMFANGMSELKKFTMFGLQGAVSENGEYLQLLGAADTLFGSVLNSWRGFLNVFQWLTTSMSGIWYRFHPALDPDDALLSCSKMFSSNPARLLNIMDTKTGSPGTGSVEKGKWADLLLIDLNKENHNRSHIEHVWLKGKLVQ